MEDNIDFVQERNSGGRKGFFYDKELGGYVPAKGKTVSKTVGIVQKIQLWANKNRVLLLIFVTAIVVLGFYIYKRNQKSKSSKNQDE